MKDEIQLKIEELLERVGIDYEHDETANQLLSELINICQSQLSKVEEKCNTLVKQKRALEDRLSKYESKIAIKNDSNEWDHLKDRQPTDEWLKMGINKDINKKITKQ